MPNHDIDAIDLRILAALQDDGRLSNVELAEVVGLSPSPCLRRVKALEGKGYIEGYRALLGRERVRLGATVFLGIRIEGHANRQAETFEKAILAMPEVVACHMVSGEADYLLEVVVPDLERYQRFLLEKLLELPMVREVRSNIAIRSLKASAALPLAHLAPPSPPNARRKPPAGPKSRHRRR